MNELFDKTDLEENFVEYFIYFKNLTENVKIPNKDNLEASLIELSIQIFSFINKYTKKLCLAEGAISIKNMLFNRIRLSLLIRKNYYWRLYG
jgi:hypothetical protein